MNDRSVTSRMIDEVVGKCFYELLRKMEFRKISRTFYTTDEAIMKILYFQASRLNTPEEAQFTVELALTTGFFHEIWTGMEMPKNPSRAACVINRRIGHLYPDNLDHWWKITPQTNIKHIAEEVVAQITDVGIPFFNRICSIADLIDTVNKKSKPPFSLYDPTTVTAILLASQGRWKESHEMIGELHSANKSTGFNETLNTIEDRLNTLKT